MRKLIFVSPISSPQAKKSRSRKRRRSSNENTVDDAKTQTILDRPPTPTEGFL